jgi:D-alanyl-D-alanine carboxypeptidase
MTLRFSRLLICLICAFFAMPSAARESEDIRWIDGQLAATFKADEPGATVIVVKDAKPVFRKAYGMANLELGDPMQPDMIFRIGSVTKQFTAVAILMLVERGELALTDEITKFLPDYPTQGKTITVEHLLTHTSGIKNYTSMAEWRPLLRKDLELSELVAIFQSAHLEFSPGDRFAYSNSGYVLLGAIIEKITGLTYAEFMERNILSPLGMRDSRYDRTELVHPATGSRVRYKGRQNR